MIFNLVISSKWYKYYLPPSRLPITAHLFPNSLCNSNIRCSSSRLQSSFGKEVSIWVVYLNNYISTVPCNAYRSSPSRQTIRLTYALLHSIWWVYYSQRQISANDPTLLSKVSFLPLYQTNYLIIMSPVNQSKSKPP